MRESGVGSRESELLNYGHSCGPNKRQLPLHPGNCGCTLTVPDTDNLSCPICSSSGRVSSFPGTFGLAWVLPLPVSMGLSSFRDLEVWQVAMDLVDLVVQHTPRMPAVAYGLRRQMQDAAVSIPSNVAEGYRRKKRRAAYQNHVSIAMGSQGELETELEIAFRNQFLNREACAEVVETNARVGAMLNRLHDSLDS